MQSSVAALPSNFSFFLIYIFLPSNGEAESLFQRQKTAPPVTDSCFQHPFKINNPPRWLLLKSSTCACRRPGHHEAAPCWLCMQLGCPLKSVNSLLIHNRASITLSACANQWHPWSCVNAEDANGNVGMRDDKCCGQTLARARSTQGFDLCSISAPPPPHPVFSTKHT